MSMNCPFCRAQIPEDSRFCDQCGKELHFCPECGKPKKGTICAACGADLICAEAFFGLSAKPLCLVSGGTRIELREGVFGRTQGVFPEFSGDKYVSGRHGEFRLNGGVWQVRDLGSTNGTYVDGCKIGSGNWVDFKPGSEIVIAVTGYKVS